MRVFLFVLGALVVADAVRQFLTAVEYDHTQGMFLAAMDFMAGAIILKLRVS